ncbi:VanW family protein [Demequina sp.]|uniref:VanW family protein n=1 Tax=Demequina sp. TaxID=2050685 RepID=UPI0025F9BF10|nr:VanW family protein [Demequina sp.]
MATDAETGTGEHQAWPDADHAVGDDAVVEQAPERQVHWGRWVALVVVVLLGAGYLGTAVYAAGRIPAGTFVLGVDIGGLGRAAAVEALAPAVTEVGTTPVILTAEERSASIVPDDSGLVADADATVDSLMRFSLNPYDILRTFTGRRVDLVPVTTVDEDALVAAVEATGETLDVPAQDAGVIVAETGASGEPAVDGEAVDAEATAAGLAAAWPVDTFPAVTAPAPAQISTADAETFAAELNADVLAGEVAMTGPNGDATVTSEQLTRFGSVVAIEGALALTIDGEPLAAELESADPTLVSAASSASFRFDANHALKTVESQPGRAIDGALLGDAVVAAATSADRAGELPYKETEPAITSDELGVSDFTKKVAGFATPLTPEPIRTKNLVRGAELITGQVVQPGDTFSLLGALSPITAENGFYPAHVIVDGFISDGIGGGLSQMATTLYNASYFTGLEDVEHRPHSKYFSRYPAGRESTIYIGSIDVKFKNNTPFALVLSSYVTGGELHVDVWSTPYFTVKTSASPRSNVKKATTVESDHEGCINTPIGADGFTITNTREVFLKGDLVDKKSYTWTYKPNDGVRCV